MTIAPSPFIRAIGTTAFACIHVEFPLALSYPMFYFNWDITFAQC